ncbi:MAG: DUF167 domain-containing protein [Actinomycetota bacterium]
MLSVSGNPLATITVRVVPRSTTPGVEAGPELIVVRVRAAAERGRATEEARRALAGALRVPASCVSLRAGARSRVKVFRVEGLSSEEASGRLGGP